MEGQERAEGRSRSGILVNHKVQRDLNAATGFCLDLLLVEGVSVLEGIAHQTTDFGFESEDAVDAAAKEPGTWDAEKPLNGIRDQGSTALGGEQQDAVLQVRHDGIEVFLESGEDLLDIAHA